MSARDRIQRILDGAEAIKRRTGSPTRFSSYPEEDLYRQQEEYYEDSLSRRVEYLKQKHSEINQPPADVIYPPALQIRYSNPIPTEPSPREDFYATSRSIGGMQGAPSGYSTIAQNVPINANDLASTFYERYKTRSRSPSPTVGSRRSASPIKNYTSSSMHITYPTAAPVSVPVPTPKRRPSITSATPTPRSSSPTKQPSYNASFYTTTNRTSRQPSPSPSPRRYASPERIAKLAQPRGSQLPPDPFLNAYSVLTGRKQQQSSTQQRPPSAGVQRYTSPTRSVSSTSMGYEYDQYAVDVAPAMVASDRFFDHSKLEAMRILEDSERRRIARRASAVANATFNANSTSLPTNSTRPDALERERKREVDMALENQLRAHGSWVSGMRQKEKEARSRSTERVRQFEENLEEYMHVTGGQSTTADRERLFFEERVQKEVEERVAAELYRIQHQLQLQYLTQLQQQPPILPFPSQAPSPLNAVDASERAKALARQYIKEAAEAEVTTRDTHLSVRGGASTPSAASQQSQQSAPPFSSTSNGTAYPIQTQLSYQNLPPPQQDFTPRQQPIASSNFGVAPTTLPSTSFSMRASGGGGNFESSSAPMMALNQQGNVASQFGGQEVRFPELYVQQTSASASALEEQRRRQREEEAEREIQIQKQIEIEKEIRMLQDRIQMAEQKLDSQNSANSEAKSAALENLRKLEQRASNLDDEIRQKMSELSREQEELSIGEQHFDSEREKLTQNLQSAISTLSSLQEQLKSAAESSHSVEQKRDKLSEGLRKLQMQSQVERQQEGEAIGQLRALSEAANKDLRDVEARVAEKRAQLESVRISKEDEKRKWKETEKETLTIQSAAKALIASRENVLPILQAQLSETKSDSEDLETISSLILNEQIPKGLTHAKENVLRQMALCVPNVVDELVEYRAAKLKPKPKKGDTLAAAESDRTEAEKLRLEEEREKAAEWASLKLDVWTSTEWAKILEKHAQENEGDTGDSSSTTSLPDQLLALLQECANDDEKEQVLRKKLAELQAMVAKAKN